MRYIFRVCLMFVCIISLVSTSVAQDKLAAVMEVLEAGVEVQRVNTSNRIAVTVEAIVGVGDIIYTNETGRARVTYFADGVDTEILQNTAYRIGDFSESDAGFRISAEVLIGQTLQRIGRTLDAGADYSIETPGMTLAARGTEFAVRVEESGRSAMLVTESRVDAESEGVSAAVADGFGIRSAVGQELSDVVRATNFDQLDAALDGCTVSVSTPDDVQLNVRLGPNLDQPRIGTVDATTLSRFFGVSEEGGWYRISFGGWFGWILSNSVTIQGTCAGLREFPNTHVEDTSQYTASELGSRPDPAVVTPGS